MMKPFLIVMLLLSSVVQADYSASDIMRKVDERNDGESIISQQTLVLINKNNQKKIRQIQSYAKEYGDDTKSIVYLLQPAEVRNMAFLSYNWQDSSKEDENWMYMPALGSINRMPASDQKNAFMGSDFSFADMSGLEVNEWSYRLIDENADVNGQACFKIEAVPAENVREKVLDETGYERVEHWVSKENYLILQSKMYLENSSKNKTLEMDDIRTIQGILTPHRITMKTYKGTRLEHASVLLLDDVVYDEIVDDNMFTTNKLSQSPI